MRISIFTFLLTLSLSNAWAGNVIVVSIFGKDMGVKKEDFRSVNAKIGNLISNFKLDSFKILAYGIEGGYTACLTPLKYSDNSIYILKMSY